MLNVRFNLIILFAEGCGKFKSTIHLFNTPFIFHKNHASKKKACKIQQSIYGNFIERNSLVALCSMFMFLSNTHMYKYLLRIYVPIYVQTRLFGQWSNITRQEKKDVLCIWCSTNHFILKSHYNMSFLSV